MTPPELYIAKSGAQQAPTLPADAVARSFAVFGQRGTGKTNTAVVMVEEMARKGGHVAVLDPVGAWWGITRAGRKRGVEGIVIGGEHGDVPLEEAAGELVAEMVVDRHWPVVVLDMSELRKGAQVRFMADYLESLFHLQARSKQPLCQVFEEADRALPQQMRSSDVNRARVLGAGEDIVKLGRGRGLGAICVTQRPATLNKNVLEVCETLILHRLMGPRDRKAAKEWVEANADAAAEKRVMDSLASLDVGEAWLWSPGWLRKLARIRVRERTTFDSSATPEVGAKVAEPTKRAPVDLEALRGRMAETVERAKANDPKALRARVAELERELEGERAKPDATPAPLMSDEKADELLSALRRMEDHVGEWWPKLGDTIEQARGVKDSLAAELRGVDQLVSDVQAAMNGSARRAETPSGSPKAGSTSLPATRGGPSPAAPRPAAAAASVGVPADAPALKKVERAILSALVQYLDEGRTTRQVAVLTGYAQGGGGFRNGLGRLRSLGFISPAGEEPIKATAEGSAYAQALGVEPLPRGRALLDYWMRQLRKKAEREVLEVLYEAYPDSLTPEEVAERTPSGYAPGGGGFRNALGKLRTLELVHGRVRVCVAEEFFA